VKFEWLRPVIQYRPQPLIDRSQEIMAKARIFKVVKHFSGYPAEDDFAIVEEELPPLRDGGIDIEARSRMIL
jgi:hypothetical protein